MAVRPRTARPRIRQLQAGPAVAARALDARVPQPAARAHSRILSAERAKTLRQPGLNLLSHRAAAGRGSSWARAGPIADGTRPRPARSAPPPPVRGQR